MSSAYTVFVPPAPGTPKGLEVRIVVMHPDGRDLTREELEALFIAYPPPAKDRAKVRKNIDVTPEAPAVPAKRTGAAKSTPKKRAA